MKNNTESTIELTDAEVYEMELLLLEKFEEIEFKPIEYQSNENILVVKNPEFEDLLKCFYPSRYSKDENGNIKVSFFIFRVLQSRFFRNNKSVKI